MFEHIVVPLDGTPLAEQALRPAVSLARTQGAHVHLATVLRPSRDEFLASSAVESIVDGEDYLEGVLNKVREAGVSSVSAEQLNGEDIADTLEAHRKGLGAGLTVMCTHGRGAVERAWLGSVADRLVRASEAPVLLVRAAAGEDAPDGDLRTAVPFKRVLVALDGTHFSRQALGPAGQLGGKSDAVYILARVIESPDAVGPDAEARKTRAIEESKIEFEVKSFAPDGYDVESVVEFAPSAARGILDLAGSREADVIVIATHARSGVSRLVLGSVADKVIRAADLPVLVVRPTEP